jgi:hypothetical protein
MRRLHLFEWEDQLWLPRVFRDFITDQLTFETRQRRTALPSSLAARCGSLRGTLAWHPL